MVSRSDDQMPQHRISLEQAKQLVRNHERTAPDGAERCGYFSRGIIDEILAHPGCAGIRFYHGRDAKGNQALVLIGVTTDKVDLVDGPIADNHQPCPPQCGGSQLGSSS
ncbi:MAG: hypothetical protein ACREND_08785 [Gemmatimonadaceae bacterium]